MGITEDGLGAPAKMEARGPAGREREQGL